MIRSCTSTRVQKIFVRTFMSTRLFDLTRSVSHNKHTYNMLTERSSQRRAVLPGTGLHLGPPAADDGHHTSARQERSISSGLDDQDSPQQATTGHNTLVQGRSVPANYESRSKGDCCKLDRLDHVMVSKVCDV